MKGKIALIENIEGANESIVNNCVVGQYFGEEGIFGQEKGTCILLLLYIYIIVTAKAVFSSQLFSLNLNLIRGTYHFDLLKYKIISDDNCTKTNR